MVIDMIDCKYYRKRMKKDENNKNGSKMWLTKLLLSIIFVLVSLIYINFDDDNKKKYQDTILEDNIDFYDINQVYDKYVGEGEDNLDTVLTFNDSIIASEVVPYGNSYQLTVGKDYLINVLEPGIIVYIGEKDDLGNTIIVQGNDGVDIWYSNISISEFSLYDYVSTGDTLGISNGEYVYLSILKDGNHITYEEYFKN